MDVPGTGAAVGVAEGERRLPLQGVARSRGEEVDWGGGNGRSATESQVGIGEGQRVGGRRRGPGRAQETSEADALAELMPGVLAAVGESLALVGDLSGGEGPTALLLVEEVAAGPVGAIAKVVEGSAGLRLVLGVAVQPAQLRLAVGKLALVAVLAAAALLEATAEFSLIAVGGEQRLGLYLGGQRGGGREARRGSQSSSRSQGEGIQVFQLATVREKAAAGLGQTHGAIRPEGELLLFVERGLTPYVVRPEGSAVIAVVNLFGAGAIGRRGG